MRKDTIIFDLDGTLLNTLDDMQNAINHVLSSFGYKTKTKEQIKSYVGNGIRIALKRALPENITEEELEKIVAYFKIYYKDHMDEKTVPYKDVILMLNELSQKGYKLGIVSNKYYYAVKQLNKKFFEEYIHTAIGESKQIKKKPNPDGILQAIEELGSSLEKCVYVGDSDVDINTAKNLGIPCISVLWGYKDKKFLEENGAEFFAQTPKDIIKIIEKNLFLS